MSDNQQQNNNGGQQGGQNPLSGLQSMLGGGGENMDKNIENIAKQAGYDIDKDTADKIGDAVNKFASGQGQK